MSRPSATRKPRHDQEPMARVLLRAIVVGGLLLAMGWLAITVYNGVPGKHYRYVNATVPNAGSLILHDAVRIGGVRKGQVRAIGTAANGDALLRLQLDGDTHLTKDTRILVRANGLLGARFVELIPSRNGPPLPAGQDIHGGADSITYGATDALDVFDKRTRGGLRSMVGELGQGFTGQGENVNDLLRIGGYAIGPADEFFRAVNRPGPNRALLPSLNSMMGPLDDNRVAIGRLFGVGADAFAPFPDERAATQDTLSEAPGALSAADSGLTEGRTLLRAARALAYETRLTLPPAPAALRATTALLRDAPGPLRSANGLLHSASAAIPATLDLTKRLSPVLPRVTTFSRITTRIANRLGPYGCNLENIAVIWRSMTGIGNRGPGGPGGPPMAFRIQAASPTGLEQLGTPDPIAAAKRDGHPAPCSYLAGEYPTVSLGKRR
jgi:ABC-type transporter Mla subunit MlaD